MVLKHCHKLIKMVSLCLWHDNQSTTIYICIYQCILGYCNVHAKVSIVGNIEFNLKSVIKSVIFERKTDIFCQAEDVNCASGISPLFYRVAFVMH